MELDIDFSLVDGLAGLDDLIGQENFDDFPFLGMDADLGTALAEPPVEKMEGIQAQDLSSLLEQFEEVSQSLDGIDFPKVETASLKSKSLPASRVCSAASSPAHTPPATPPPCVLDKIRARQGKASKRKSTIMLPMGAPAKRSRGQATMLGMSAAASGSSKLQRVLSRNNLCPVQPSVSLQPQPQTAGRGAKQQVTPRPTSEAVNGTSQIIKLASATAFQSIVPAAASCAPVTRFSSQPVILGSNVAHPVPLILSAVSSTGGQRSIPVQLMVASSGSTVGGAWLGTRTSGATVPPPRPANTSSSSGSCVVVSASSKPVVKPPPLTVQRAPRKHFTTVNTRAEGISPHVLDSVMDHDYCADSPRRVIIDEFELDLSPTKPIHRVKSLPIIKSESSTSSFEADFKGRKSSHTSSTKAAAVSHQGNKGSSPAVSLLGNGNKVPVHQRQSQPLDGDREAAHATSASVTVRKSVDSSVSPQQLYNTSNPAKPGLTQVTVEQMPVSVQKDSVSNTTCGGVQLKPALNHLTKGETELYQQQSASSAGRADVCNEQPSTPGGKFEHLGLKQASSDPGVIPFPTENVDLHVSGLVHSQAIPSEGLTVQRDPACDTRGKQGEGLTVQRDPACDTRGKQGAEAIGSAVPEKETPVLLSMPCFDDEEMPCTNPSERVGTPVPSTSGGKASNSKAVESVSPSNVEGSDSVPPSDSGFSKCESAAFCDEERTTLQEKCDVYPTDSSVLEEQSGVVPHSPGHFDDIPHSPAWPAPQESSQTAAANDASEMYTEEDLAQADRERFIRFDEEEERFTHFDEEEERTLPRGRGSTGRGSRKSQRSRRWRPGTSPVKEDSSSFFNKIPNYYTALSKPTKTGRKQLTADGLEGMSINDFIPQDNSPSHESTSSTYSKLPAYHSCFTNSTKYDDAVGEDNSFHGSDHGNAKPVYSFAGSLSESRQSRSRSSSRSRSRERSTSRRQSRKRVRSASSSDSSRSRSGSRHRKGRKRSRRSRSSVSGSSRSSSASRSRSSSRSLSRSPSRSVRRRSRPTSKGCSLRRKQKQKDKIRKMEERKIVYVGRIPESYTRKDLRRRFERFGQIEDVSVHFREAGDNYGFVTFFYTCDAYAAIDKGNDDPNEMKFDLCFGGRRHFCANDYADLDGNLVIEEEYTPIPSKDPVGFDELLKQAQQKLKKKW